MVYYLRNFTPFGGKCMTVSKRIHTIYRIVLSIALIFAGICLMAACLNIYKSGDKPFSREAVAEQFGGIAVPVYLALALTVGGFILDLVLPWQDKKRKDKNYTMILESLWRKRDLASASPEIHDAILAQQKFRRINTTVSAVLLGVCSIIFLCYGVNPGNFLTTNINGSMLNAVVFLLMCLAIPFGYTVFSAYSNRRSMMKEIELVKQIAPGGSPAAVATRDYTLIVRLLLLALAFCLIAYGYFAGGTLDVLTKAANICTECVGLG